MSPTLRWALQIGWGAVLLAVVAAAFLLQGVMTLSERRAAFVSSVTHELRTPLTTFRMYAEMLAKGMVPDANRRQEYFNTLQREAERLTLLVENVLAYARLERGRQPQAQDRVTLAALLDRVGPRLKQRAAQAGMQCELQLDENAAHQEFTTDQAVVEQILFNLVDNAAKYAREADGSADSCGSESQWPVRAARRARSWAGHQERLVVAADAAVREERTGIGRVGAGRGAGAGAVPAVGAAVGRAVGDCACDGGATVTLLLPT